MTSLRSLASELGLSVTTVSRALDGYEDVAVATRERVSRAAAAAGYRPNSAARRLRKGSSETVALVMPTEPGRFYEPVFVDLLAVIGERLAARHYDLMLLAARPGAEELAAYRRIVKDRRADACIIVRTRRHDERVALLQEAGLPFVCHGRTETHAPYAFVDGDGEAGFREVTSRLVSLGHRRIAHLAAPDRFTFAELRARGWHMAMRAAGLADDLKLMCASSEEAGEQAATELLAGPERPTALICATDRIAIGAIRAVQAAGLVAGRDIAVTGHDNIHASRFTHPALTTMELEVQPVGECLADKLLHLIERGMPERAGDVFPLRQIVRASSGEAD
ncbi:MAG: substrate-binding domain-containing protein [Proteobacteria bacterium]|nr:substrate-binding domain-containing protein [Pseudomonadota bacterium]